MEEWEFDFEWLRVRHYVKDALGYSQLPDMRAILMLIGIQELGFKQSDFSKEEKQDLMHIAVCTLLEPIGYFAFVGRDDQGWPHWDRLKLFKLKGAKPQEQLIKKQIIHYFEIANNEEE